MDRMSGYSIIGIYILLVVVSDASSRIISKRAIEKTECQQLEKAILKFTKTCKGPNFLLDTWGLGKSIDKDSVKSLQKVIRLDLYDKKDVQELTTILCQARSRAYISYALRVDIATVDEFYENYLDPVKTYGRLNSFKTVAKLTVKLLEWTLRTGYPMVPLYRTRKRSIERFLTDIQEDMTSDPRVRKALRGTLYPLAYDPQYASMVISEAKSLGDLAQVLQIPEVWLRTFAKKMRPRKIAKYIKTTRHALRLYKVANKLGILDLQ